MYGIIDGMNKTPLKNTVRLTDKSVKAIEPTDKPQKFADEKGLYLYVSQHGTKSWRYDYRVGGKRATVTFGKYPEVTLANARKKHLEARTKLANGGDPAQEKKVQKLERQNLQSNTFDDVAKIWFESKAISAACGAVDSATSLVYQQAQLGDPAGASFQERCKRASLAKGVIPSMEQELRSLGWAESEIVPFKKNFEGALTQGAYVMQMLRSKMGDVHGTKPIIKPLVFDSLKWAELLVRSLSEK